MSAPPTPARRVAFEVLRRVFEDGAWADRALRSAAARAGLSGRERAHAQRLAYGAVQRRGSCDYVVARLASRPVRRIDPPLLAALRLGCFELLFDDQPAAHAVVSQAVSLAAGRRGSRRGAGLVNAVLRRVAREGRALLGEVGEATPQAAAVTHSVPTWIAELLFAERGREVALGVLRASNAPPSRCYRLTLRGAESGALGALEAAGADLAALGPPFEGAFLATAGWETIEEAVARGELVPQAPGSLLAAASLRVAEGDRVLDLCAAPGIKTTQLAEAAGRGEVLAVERDAGRASALRELCSRAGAGNVEVLVADGRDLERGSGYDRVLVDAPCSALGTLASRPDARWRRTPGELEETVAVQRGLLAAGARALRPGGTLLFSLCTLSRAEGPGVAGSAPEHGLELEDLGAVLPALADPHEPRALQLLPGRDPGDGFFIARMRRRGNA